MSKSKIKVFVGLSGGVDSSTTAYLLKKAGYQVVGVYMKNWSSDIGSYKCPWRQDYLAAKKLASFLDIQFLVFDFQKEYKKLVVDDMLTGYQQGLTPNPDVICNQKIKFDLFLNKCLDEGAHLVATGHYAKISDNKLQIPEDKTKDQTYFLYRLPSKSLVKIIFPLGDYLKTKVRQIALKANLPNALRTESMGLCFIGEVGLVEFLKHHVPVQSGAILDDKGQNLGQHQGAIFYTLGQRHGLNVGGGLPYYVVGKDMAKNIVYVSSNLNHPSLWTKEIYLIKSHWLQTPLKGVWYQARLRHGGGFLKIKLRSLNFKQQISTWILESSCKTTAIGQSVVIYNQNSVLGGGFLNYKKTQQYF